MRFSNRSIFLIAVALVLLITSVKSCVFSDNLGHFGKKLLTTLKKTPFNDYNGIENLKNSLKTATDLSNVASTQVINQIFSHSSVKNDSLSIGNAIAVTDDTFNTAFSLLTPYNTYLIEEMESIAKKFIENNVRNHSTLLINKLLNNFGADIKNILTKFQQKPFESHCDSSMSIHHKAVGVYNRAVLNLIKGFAIIIYLSKQFYRLPSLQLRENEADHLMITYDALTRNLSEKLKTSVNNLSRDIHRCDPDEHIHEKTFDRLYEVVEYYITSERFLNNNDQCNKNPSQYHGVQHPIHINNHIDESLVCYGTLYECKNINLKHIFLYGNDKIYRRYHAFSVADSRSPEGEKVYGQLGDATTEYTDAELNAVYDNSTDPPKLIETRKCPIYGCYCDSHDSPRTVRYFSTRLVMSDTKHNKVITGLKLEIVNKVVYIKIQTGKLVGVGIVDPASVSWRKIEEVDTSIDEYSREAAYVSFNYSSRSLYLDDLSDNKGSYLIGVKFVRAKNGIRIGALLAESPSRHIVFNGKRKFVTITDENRTELQVDKHIKLPGPDSLTSQSISVQNKDYVRFQASDIEEDAAQTTIPFLDIQPVETSPPTALGGFGIYHKAGSGFTGFVALKLISPKFVSLTNF